MSLESAPTVAPGLPGILERDALSLLSFGKQACDAARPLRRSSAPSKGIALLDGEAFDYAGVKPWLKQGYSLCAIKSAWGDKITVLELVPHPGFMRMPRAEAVAAALEIAAGVGSAEGAAVCAAALKRNLTELLEERLKCCSDNGVMIRAVRRMRLKAPGLAVFSRPTPPLCAALAAEQIPFVVRQGRSRSALGGKVDIFMPREGPLAEKVIDLILAWLAERTESGDRFIARPRRRTLKPFSAGAEKRLRFVPAPVRASVERADEDQTSAGAYQEKIMRLRREGKIR